MIYDSLYIQPSKKENRAQQYAKKIKNNLKKVAHNTIEQWSFVDQHDVNNQRKLFACQKGFCWKETNGEIINRISECGTSYLH